MKITTVCILTLFVCLPIAAEHFAVNGGKDYKKAFRTLINEPDASFPTPSILAVDTETKEILTYEALLKLLNKDKSLPALDSIPKFISHDTSQYNIDRIPSEFHTDKKYIVFYYNPERLLVNMMEKMLKVDMNGELKKISEKVATLDATIVYNGKGVYREFFLQ